MCIAKHYVMGKGQKIFFKSNDKVGQREGEIIVAGFLILVLRLVSVWFRQPRDSAAGKSEAAWDWPRDTFPLTHTPRPSANPDTLQRCVARWSAIISEDQDVETRTAWR